jgi:hypothetical protein
MHPPETGNCRWYPNVSEMGGLAGEAVLLGLGVGVPLGEGDDLGDGSTGARPREGGIGSAPGGPVGVSD